MINKILRLTARTSSGSFIVLIVILSRLLGILEPLELFYLDLLFRARQAESQDNRIVLIEITSVAPLEGKNSKLSPQKLINLIDQIEAHEPAVVGFNVLRDLIDDSDPTFQDLSKLVDQQKNVISAESFIPPFIYALPNVNPEKVGFVNVIHDSDGFIRRTLLASYDFQDKEKFKLSFSLLLAKYYLEEKHGYVMDNGDIDPAAIRFDDIEIPRIYSSTGGYKHTDNTGVQTMVNYRKAPLPFKVIHFKDFSTDLDSELLRNKIVIIGTTDDSKRAVLKTPLDKQMSGLKMTAHFTSQITSAVLDGRPLLRSLPEVYEYIFIILLATPVIWIWSGRTSLLNLLLAKGLVLLFILTFSYLLFAIYGYWIVVFPSILILSLNLIAYLSSIYRDELRRKAIERTFDILHNGPLQSLSIILNDFRGGQIQYFDLENKLVRLSQDIREIGDTLKGESLRYEQSLFLKSSTGNSINLSDELHELLYQIYSATLQRDFKNFRHIKTRIRAFDAISISQNNFSLKREICRYLEEAICNVGRHAIKPTRLIVTGQHHKKKGFYILTVQDDGLIKLKGSRTPGQGTKSAIRLAKKLNGEFKREHIPMKGTLCQLRWKT